MLSTEINSLKCFFSSNTLNFFKFHLYLIKKLIKSMKNLEINFKVQSTFEGFPGDGQDFVRRSGGDPGVH